MAKWSAGSETGILRKPVARENFDDLLVFGYACKIFREDEKALHIDQGKHLIPWMGNSMLKIDRYDCRGALSELTPYEGTDHDASHWLGLSESERRIELLCDEERYYALKHNEEELEMYQEEETKRLLQKGTEFQYNYDVPRNPEQTEDTVDVAEHDETFIPPLELNIPADMEVPKTVKENARIEKTAMFVSSQGPQMEILIKTKQADNPQFYFMNKDNPLYKYYKHVLTVIKSGQYKVQPEAPTTEPKAEDTSELEEHEGHYLHPSLVATSVVQSAQPPPPLPTVTYKPSADCTYSQLVSRIQGTQSESATPPPPLPSQEVPQSQMTYEQQQYYQQYYYAAQYYEYYKQVAQQFTGQNASQSPTNALQDAGFTPEQVYALCQNHSEFQNILQSQAVYQQYAQQPSNPYAQLVSNLSQSQGKETYTPAVPTLNDISKAPILYTKSEPEEPHIPAPVIGPQLPSPAQEPEPENITETEKSTIKMPLLSLAQYGSDSEEESDEEDDIRIPPKDLQQIIDKMAIYVSKNGKDFETIVKAKGDSRFQFLNDGHEFNRYYKMKMGEYLSNIIQENGVNEKPKEKKVIAPVSFSIKKPKDETPKEIKSALPIEESDEEHENGVVTAAKTSPTTVPVPAAPPTPSSPEVVHSNSLTPPLKETPVTPSISPNQENGKDEIVREEIPENIDINKQVDAEDLILEMIDITEDLEERRESKRVENSKKDKITAAVRERLALQLERKKKAAAFLKLKTNATIETEVKTEKSKDTQVKISKTSKARSKHSENSNTLDKSSKLIKDNANISMKLKISKDGTSSLNKLTSNNGSHKTSEAAKETKTLKEKIIEEIINIEDSDLEEGEIKKHKKSVKKKKAHKRKHSKSRHQPKSSRHRHRSKEHKKSKKRRKRSESGDGNSSESS